MVLGRYLLVGHLGILGYFGSSASSFLIPPKVRVVLVFCIVVGGTSAISEDS